MQIFVLIVLALLFMVGAWFWGKASDPKQGGTVGCCHCGQCISAGECVLRKNMQKKTVKEEIRLDK